MTSRRRPPRTFEQPDEFIPPDDAADFIEPTDAEMMDSVAVAPAMAQPVEPAPTSWVEALFPRSSAAADRPAYSPQALASAAQDVASLPGRALAASVRPEGEGFAESMARLQGSPRTGERGMLPGQEMSETIMRDPVTGALAVVPTWIPARLLAATGRGAALGRGLLAGTQAGGLVAGSRQAERVAGGQGVAPGEIGTDLGIGAGLGGLGPVAGSGLRRVGGKLKQGGEKVLREVIKPAKDEVEGFAKAMSAGLLPQAAGLFTITPGQAGQRFMSRLRTNRDIAYAPAVAEATATGATVNMERAQEAAMRSLREDVDAGRVVLGEDEIARARDWLGDRLLYRDAAGREALEQANIPYQGRYIPLMGQEEIRRTVARQSAPDATRLGLGLPGGSERVSVVTGYKPVVEGFEKLPDYLQPIPDVVRPVTPAHQMKSALQDIAYSGGDPKAIAPKAAIVAAAKGADRAIRSQIGEVSPAYAAADATMAPWYAGADAFQRAADVRANNYTMDALAALIGGGAGVQQGIGQGLGGAILATGATRYARSPALARHLWEAGRGAQFLGAQVPRYGTRLGLGLRGSSTDNAR